MTEKSFDLVVVGAGPGGYVCAIRASQLGLKTALVEKSPTLGGTCLNIGCIPSKALLHYSEMARFSLLEAKEIGLRFSHLSIDVPAMMRKKDKAVSTLSNGVSMLVKKKGVEVFQGTGRIVGDSTVEVSGDEDFSLKARNIVLAAGSVPVELPSLPFDGKTVVDSTRALSFEEAPKTLAVIGGGAIGLELGSVWSRLGSKVTIVEFLPSIASSFDDDVSKLLTRSLTKQGLSFELSATATGIRNSDKGTFVTAKRNDGEEMLIPAEKVLVAVGRAPFTKGLGLDKAGVVRDERGRIITNERFETNVPGVYGIGDAIQGPMLAHKAEEEGVAVAELIAGKAGHVNYDLIPNVIYTDPELASAGITEREAKVRNIEYRIGKFPFAANGRGIASNATEGFVKIIAETKTDRLMGVQIIGKGASELIAAAVAHMEYGGSAEDLARTVHAHPTLSEALKEAALALDGRAIHSL